MAPQVPTVQRRRLGLELRRLRDGLSLTVDEVAKRLNWSSSKLSRIENARIGVRLSDVRLLLELYGVDEGHLGELLALTQAATRPGWWLDFRDDIFKGLADYIAHEDEAERAYVYESQLVPGLLQTPSYARAIIASGGVVQPTSPRTVERRMELRMRRQRVLDKADPLRLSVLLDESALLRNVGGAEVMNGQLRQLAEWSRRPNVDLRILPLERMREPVISESFTLMSFPVAYQTELGDVLFLDNIYTSEFRDDATVHIYRLTWDRLLSSALSAEDSQDLVLRTAHTKWQIYGQTPTS
ncbi:helix-turn-helix domain-containing protein [Spirillospora albida]|uniref:helix-turn-helix domain-containing protein n=1 Tax=Spirillospora albida TaxID=58123 RepID=UPI0004BECFE5|nr:helix-turn-helix transcriptional regulator [Spirillospora albida]